MAATLLVFFLGLISGLLFKGVNIKITYRQNVEPVDKPKYNKSMAGMLPQEVQEYYHKTQGQNKF